MRRGEARSEFRILDYVLRKLKKPRRSGACLRVFCSFAVEMLMEECESVPPNHTTPELSLSRSTMSTLFFRDGVLNAAGLIDGSKNGCSPTAQSPIEKLKVMANIQDGENALGV